MSTGSRIKVYYPQPPAAEYLAQLQARLDPAIHLTTGDNRPAPPDMNILIAGRPARQDLDDSPALHTLIGPTTGRDQVSARSGRPFESSSR